MAVLAVVPPAVAQEAVITVTRTDDPAPDGCRPGDCSLREAVAAANALSGQHVVALPAGVIQLSRLDGTPTTRSGVGPGLYITGDVVLRGADRQQSVIDLSRLSPRDAETGEVGPGIMADGGSLTVEHLTVRDAQEAATFTGVLLAREAAVTLRSVDILNNQSGWAITVDNPDSGRPVLVEDSVFRANHGVLRLNGANGPEDEGGYQVVVQDSHFHRNGSAISASARVRVRGTSFIRNVSSSGAMNFGEPALLEEVLVESNTATSLGGGVHAIEDLVVRDSVFRGNVARHEGGAIRMSISSSGPAVLEVSNSAFVGNTAPVGGAIGIVSHAARLTNVTLSGNVARGFGEQASAPFGRGAALHARVTGYENETGTVSLVNSTVTGNRGDAGAIVTGGRLEIAGSVVADTTTRTGASAPNCSTAPSFGATGVVVSEGFNVSDDDSCGLDAVGDQVAEPELAPLTATGGTLSHLPLPGSPLVDGGGSVCPAVDQRGVVRPVDGDGDGDPLCDVGAVEALSGRVGRVAGPDRVATALEVSRATYGDLQAGVVVLARADAFADGLAGGPLAAAGEGPLLLTDRDQLDARVEAEVARVLSPGGDVVLLGGTAALRTVVEERVAALGYRPVRVAGSDRYDTAVAVARRLRDPQLVMLASGTDFPDALSAGAAAASAGGAVLLTADDQLPPSTRAYLEERPRDRVAVGGPAATADPGAEPVMGPDRYTTAVAVARRFFERPASIGISSGVAFPDALAAAADRVGRSGPLLLSTPDHLPAVVEDYLSEVAATLHATGQAARIYGGEKAISLPVEAELDAVLGP